ncbi:MAG: hypothetical protein U9Q66_03130, partial [Patescibacteria group bacterium]|nr:hypothetical protein [Patescibacteria group bacterium]
SELFHGRQVPEGFHTADNFPLFIFKHGCADADGRHRAAAVQDTDDVDRDKGSITFQDSASRKTVILQNSEVIEISKDEYKAKTGN